MVEKKKYHTNDNGLSVTQKKKDHRIDGFLSILDTGGGE